MLYLYGVVRAGQPAPQANGVGEPPGDVALIESGPLAAAATKLPDDFEIQDGDAETHLEVLIALLSNGPVPTMDGVRACSAAAQSTVPAFSAISAA